MISENLARELWGAPAAALGKRIRGFAAAYLARSDRRRAGRARQRPECAAPAIVYWPFFRPEQRAADPAFTRSVTVAIRSPLAGTEAFLRQVQQAIWSVNPNLPVASVRTMQDVLDARSRARRSLS